MMILNISAAIVSTVNQISEKSKSVYSVYLTNKRWTMWSGAKEDVKLKKREYARTYYRENREKLRERAKYYQKRKKVGRYVTDDELVETKNFTAAFCFDLNKKGSNARLKEIEKELGRLDKGVADIHRKYKEKGGKKCLKGI